MSKFSSQIKVRPAKKLKPFYLFLNVFWIISLISILTFTYHWSTFQATVNVDSSLVSESWEVAQDGAHLAFTDLIDWKGNFYLVYRSAPNHMDSRSKLVVMRSPNARSWEKLTELALAGEDIRDPKLAVIGDRLFLYALKNTNLLALPYSTVYSTSEDGEIWQPWQAVEPQGWLFWRPKTNDGLTWYVPAYSRQHDQTALFQSKDGKKWEKVSLISSDEPQSEVEISFTGDDNLIAVIRMEGLPSTQKSLSASTLIASTSPPFHTWSTTYSTITRLDGPVLFRYHGAIFAIGRSEPSDGILFGVRGGLFNKKRTSIFSVTPNGLRKLTDLPSNGDTSYPGIVIRGNEGYVSYYTNDIQQDLPWLMGQFSPTSIRIAKLKLQ